MLSTGCASRVTIRSIEPGPVYVGPATHLVLIDGEGRRSAREWVAMELGRQSRSRGYFTFEDRSEEGLDVRIAGRRAEIEGPGAEQLLDAEHAGIRVDVLEWMGHQDHELVEVVDELGEHSMETVIVQRGVVLLAITLFDGGQGLLRPGAGVLRAPPRKRRVARRITAGRVARDSWCAHRAAPTIL